MNKYWFYLKSSVYVDFKIHHILLYDTESGNYLEFTSSGIINLIKKLYDDVNLGVIFIDFSQQSIEIKKGIECICKKQMGILEEVKENSEKPIVLTPLLSLKKDMDKLLKNENAIPYLQKDLGKYLLELNLHLNATCDLFCKCCGKYDKQFLCCSKEGMGHSLSTSLLEKIFSQIQYLPLASINIIGGNCFQYENFDMLGKLKKIYNKDVSVYSHYKNISVDIFNTTYIVHAIIPYPIDTDSFQCICKNVRSQDKFHFIVEDAKQYIQVQEIANLFSVEEGIIEIHPFYNGNNMNFFDEYIYLDKDDILSKKMSMREILRNKKLNVHTFGSLHIFPNGDVKSSVLAKTIGNIEEDNLISLIFKELKENTTWRLVRDMLPCSNCVLQWFCPPPSNYEYILKKPNLCHVKS